MYLTISKKLTFAVAAILLVIFTSLTIVCTQHAQAIDVLSGPCSQGAATSSACKDDNPATGSNPLYGSEGIITKGIEIVSFIIGIASVIIVIISGMRMALSGGDTNSVNSARSSIIYAFVGIAVAVAAQTIVIFVLKGI